MNANELVDNLENAKSISEIARLVKEEVIPTLRQFDLATSIIKQQKIEIDALKNYVEAQNKKIIDLAFEKVYAERSLEIANQFNELTDGEITVLASRHLRHIECDYESTGVYKFARAILREAKAK